MDKQRQEERGRQITRWSGAKKATQVLQARAWLTRALVALVVAALYVIADPVLHLKDVVLRLLNRDATLTNRTELWATVRALQTNAIVGTGFIMAYREAFDHAAAHCAKHCASLIAAQPLLLRA